MKTIIICFSKFANFFYFSYHLLVFACVHNAFCVFMTLNDFPIFLWFIFAAFPYNA